MALFTPRYPLVMEESDVRLEPGRRIDYVLVRCDERGVTLWASDHFGLVADLAPLA